MAMGTSGPAPGRAGTTSSRPRIVVVGSLNADLVVRAERAPEEGETVIGTSFARHPGGKGANQAVAAARLGAAVTMVGRVGDDPLAADLLASLEGAGADTSCVRRDSDAPTGVALIVVDARGRNRIVMVPGANHRLAPGDIDAVRDRVAAAHVLLIQLEIPLETVCHAVELAARAGVRVVLNPAPAGPLPPEVLARVSVLTPNEVEAEQLTGVDPRDPRGAVEAARRLLDQGVGAAVITLGERGALLMEAAGPQAGQAVWIPAFPVAAVDTVAAGDAFNGALAVRLAEGAPLAEAARYASAAAAISVTRPGAQPAMPSREEVEAFLAGHPAS